MSPKRLPGQLPAGKHGITREQIEQDQRRRILRAMLDVFAKHGARGLVVEAVVQKAMLSRHTFYIMYGGIEEAFLTSVGEVVESIIDASDSNNALMVLLDLAQNDPAVLIGCIRAGAISPRGAELRDHLVGHLTKLLYKNSSLPAELRTRGLLEVLATCIEAGVVDQLDIASLKAATS
jgi:AcrR family transcriptional regulator